MNDLKNLMFGLGVLVAIWLVVSKISLYDILAAPIVGIGKGAEVTVDKWMEVKQGNKFNPRP